MNDGGILDGAGTVVDAGTTTAVDAGFLDAGVINVITTVDAGTLVPIPSDRLLQSLLTRALESKDTDAFFVLVTILALMWMLMVWIFGRYVAPNINKKYIPIISTVVSVSIAVVVHILNPNIKLSDLTWTAMLASATAGGWWSVGGKNILNGIFKPKTLVNSQPPVSDNKPS